MNEWNGWQIPHTGVAANAETEFVRTDVMTPFRRKSDMRISNFGALFLGNRMDDDYTRTVLTYISKDVLSDWKVQTEDPGLGHNSGLRGTTIDQNPYLWGSTVKRFRDDQFFRMDMEHYPYRTGMEDFGDYAPGEPTSIDKPMFDVMDTNLVHSGMDEKKNYPTEGWRSFGGKYDFLPYIGTLGRPKGNARE
jgi:hypothetical protein